MEASPHEVTQLLEAWRNGDQSALDRLIPVVYDELHQLARRQMARQAPGNTLQTTALINEAYTRLVDLDQVEWKDRSHFFAVCAIVMRRILVDRYRHRLRHPEVPLDEMEFMPLKPDVDLSALDEALTRLEALDKRKSMLVELKFFVGLTEEEAAEVLKVSVPTVKRDWKRARAWLFHEMGGGEKP